MQFNYFMELWF